jgi:hypothetical protein
MPDTNQSSPPPSQNKDDYIEPPAKGSQQDGGPTAITLPDVDVEAPAAKGGLDPLTLAIAHIISMFMGNSTPLTGVPGLPSYAEGDVIPNSTPAIDDLFAKESAAAAAGPPLARERPMVDATTLPTQYKGVHPIISEGQPTYPMASPPLYPGPPAVPEPIAPPQAGPKPKDIET